MHGAMAGIAPQNVAQMLLSSPSLAFNLVSTVETPHRGVQWNKKELEEYISGETKRKGGLSSLKVEPYNLFPDKDLPK